MKFATGRSMAQRLHLQKRVPTRVIRPGSPNAKGTGMRTMKSLMAGAAVALATAAASGTAGAAPCATTVLSNWLVAGFSCTVTTNGVTDTFSNFSYSPDGLNVPATNVGVGPSATTAGPGLLFNALWQNTGTTPLDAILNFTVTAPAPGITQADLLLDGV